ncbi:MAG: YiiX/YebB-like N1pC/P60 family cysteine hydrolase [Thiogranum sp.]
MFNPVAWLGKKIVSWLTAEQQSANPPLCDFERIRYEIRPCDVVLVEGRSRISEIIRTITQSPWSHSALYIGRVHDIDDEELRDKVLSFYNGDPNEQLIIEAWLGEGTVVNPLSKYSADSLRVCRPAGLTRQDAQQIMKFALQHLGFEYDLRQLMDLGRFLFPYSIIPRRWRSSLFEHNAGGPTRSVCSSMIAAAFAAVKFPVLPVLEERCDGSLRMVPRNSRLFTPRDFDYSPYFDIIKCPHLDFGKHPTYREMPWDRRGRVCDANGECYVPTMQPEPQPEAQNYSEEAAVEAEGAVKTT